MSSSVTILTSIAVFLGIMLLLVALLLWVRKKLIPQGKVKITINDDKELTVQSGASLMATLAEEKVFLPSACGGKGNCGQCKCRVVEGGGTILPTETGYFTRKQIQDHWRLGCQVKVKEDLKIVVPQSVLDVKEYECTVVSNRNVATFIKEFKVQLPAGEHMDFIPGSYAQIRIPKFDLKYSDFDRELIGNEYLPTWEKFKMFDLRCVNTEPTVRAYSMANYPAEGDVFMLTVRIATPPFTPDRSGFMNVNPGIASSYIFSLKPGDKVLMSGPFGEFHVKEHKDAGRGTAGRETSSRPVSRVSKSRVRLIVSSHLSLIGVSVLQQFFALGDGIVDGAHKVEGGLGILVDLAVHDHVEAADSLLDGNHHALQAGELLGDVERLRQETLHAAGAVDDDLVLF